MIYATRAVAVMKIAVFLSGGREGGELERKEGRNESCC